MIVVDVETTGLCPEKHSIVSIGAVDFLEPENQFYVECRIWYGAEITQEALEINGFSESQIKDPNKPSLEQTVAGFFSWVAKIKGSDITLAGENPSFDLRFLHSSAERYNLNFPFSHRTVDLHTKVYTHLLERGLPIKLDKRNCSGMSQDETLKYVGLPKEPKPHNALVGAKGEAEAFSRLMFGKNLFEEYSMFPIPAYLRK